MADQRPVNDLSREEFIASILELQRQIAGQREEIERLKRAHRRPERPQPRVTGYRVAVCHCRE